MSRWFRFYDDAVNDPKLIKLSDDIFRAWVNLLCVASKNDGALPATDDIAIILRVKTARAAAIIAELVSFGLLDKIEGGFAPHNWSGRQYQSDGSAERVAKYRAKRKASGLTIGLDHHKIRPALIQRDGDQCIYCGGGGNLVIDHMEPISLGGTDDEDNLALACRPCNGGKSGRTPEGARMKIIVGSAASALSRYRDRTGPVTVTVTPPEAETEQKQKQSRADTRDDSQKVLGDFRQAIVQAYAEANSPTLPDTARAGLWLTQGFDPEICLAVIASIVPKKPNAGLAYFESAIAEAHQKKAPPRKPLKSGPPPKDWEMAAKLWATNKRWPREHGNDPDSPSCQAPADILTKYGITVPRLQSF